MSNIEVVEPRAAGLNKDALLRLRENIVGDIEGGNCDGAVFLVARKGKIAWHEAVGQTDLSQGRKAQLSDRFCFMSLTKSLTAAAILRLVDQGKLTLSTRIASVIPEYGTKGKDGVTIFNALTHTGGIWSDFPPPTPLSLKESLKLSVMIKALCNQPLFYDAGSQVTYSPFAGFAILGEVIRRLDPKGRGFNQIMNEDLLAPLGMNDTSFGIAVDAPRRVPMVQREAGTGGLADRSLIESFNEIVDHEAEVPGGGAYGTAADVFRFAEMLRAGGTFDGVRYLSPAITRYALQNHTGTMRNTAWDYSRRMRGIDVYPANFALMGGYMRGTGFYMSPAGNTASPNAFASVGGGSTMMLIDPERELTFIFLCAGLLEGLNHFVRLQRLSDLAIAAVEL